MFVKLTGCLIITAFYFLLRVGEYTKPRTVMRDGKQVSETRTKKFIVGNVGFFCNRVKIPRTPVLSKLLREDIVVLKISNQKNRRMGQTITQHATSNTEFPAKVLAHIVNDILSNGGDDNTLICSVLVKGTWTPVQPHHIVTTVRKTATRLQINKQGIYPDLIGAHSLREGGAMSIKLHGYDDTKIMKIGRWTSLTFL